jgi:hypothetical protein
VPDLIAPGTVERVDWPTFVESRLVWLQGEHVTMIGPTGSGKTTLTNALLPLRSFVMFFGTKPSGRDDTAMALVRRGGYKLVRDVDRLPDVVTRRNGRIVFWPKFTTPDDVPMQAWQIGQAMRRAFVEGGWTLVVDEMWYADNVLHLGKMLEQLWSQGRSLGISLVAGTQRPAKVPLMAYDQATHVFFWRDNDESNLKRISGMNGLNARLIRETVSTLPLHHVLYVNTRTGYMAVTLAPRK